MSDAVLSRVRSAIADILNIPPGEIAPADRLAALGCRNFDRLLIAFRLEDDWLIEIGNSEIAGWDTVGDVAAAVDRKHAGSRARAAA